jgi:L-threonylcarbamoyladenylate synthase
LPNQPTLEEAARLLTCNGIVAFPTETVYGLGARADRPEAVARIFQAKNRPTFDPLIAHFPSFEAAEQWARFDERAFLLARTFWPGPLTLVLPRIHDANGPRVPDLVTAGLDTVGVRVPAQPLALALLNAVDFPVAAPSANPFGYVSPTTAEHVRQGLGNRVDLVLDGGPCTVGVESTIVDLSGPHPRLLRPGGLAREAIEETLGQNLVWEGFRPPVLTEAPGMLESHYSPSVAVEVFEDVSRIEERALELDGNCAILSATPHSGIPCREAVVLGEGTAMAVALFATLRRLDDPRTGRILALLPPPEGLGLAVRDRLYRAAKSRMG